MALLTLIAAVVRLYQLETPSMWWDEILVPLNAVTPIGDILARAATDDFHPPAFYLLLKLVLGIGDSDFALRLPATLAGIASVPLLYALAAPRVGRTTALFAAAVLAIDGSMIQYARQVRPYALVIFFSLLSAYFLLRWCERPKAGTVAGLTAATWGYVPLHYLGILILAVQGLFAVICFLLRRRGRPWGQLAVYTLGSAVAVATTWAFFHASPNTLTKGSVASTALLGLDRLAWAFFGDGSSLVARAGILILTGLGTVLLARRDRRLAILALATVAGPVILLALARYNSYFNAWHLSFAVPYLCLMAGACLDALVRPRRLAPVAAVVLGIAATGAILGFGRARYYEQQSHSANYKQQARELPAILRPGALVAYTELSDLDAIDWYASRYNVPDPLRHRTVTIGQQVAVDFVSYGSFGHLAQNAPEFLAHFDMLQEITPLAGGTVYHAAMNHARPRLGPQLPWRDTLAMTPWDIARQCDAIAGANLVSMFGGSLVPETGDGPGSLRYVIESPTSVPSPLFVRLTVPYSNPVAGNVLRMTYAFDGEPPLVAFESQGNEPEAVRTVILRPDKPFSRLECQFTLEPHVFWPSMTGNSGAFVRLKAISMYANAIAAEILGSSSLDVHEEGVGPVEQGEAGQWRWALGEATTLRFTLPQAGVVTADLAINNPIPGQTVELLFNGRPLEEIRELPADKWLSPSVARHLRLEGQPGDNTLTVRFAAWNGKEAAPGATFAPGDGRLLAGAFTKLRLDLESNATRLVY
ncbi:glycosyltransferase family 39 protein [Desulfovibrio sp. TomC]|uniref:glycosyltransferase family 39 protein n=1 Tax=Desulfovibrio sp. TomC TaxID=1562888 RepID=UPI000575AF6B|nr:glycosyltransferase family 39 protein [Desulfovibrio sp. TomC]KHK04338.1 putative inner membrane protein [Desulfovibrio sp. TomC]